MFFKCFKMTRLRTLNNLFKNIIWKKIIEQKLYVFWHKLFYLKKLIVKLN